MEKKTEPQTEQEFLQLYDDLVLDTTKRLLDYGRRALKSGAVGLDDVRGPYQMPKNVLTAGLLDMAVEWGPSRVGHHGAADQHCVNNVRKCTPTT